MKNELFRVAISISEELIHSSGKFVRNLSKSKEILGFKCNQFEADTIMFSIYYNIRSIEKDTMVVTDVTDTPQIVMFKLLQYPRRYRCHLH